MAIEEPLQEVNLRLLRETASTKIEIGRRVRENPLGGLIHEYPVNVYYGDIVYEVDAAGVRTGIYEELPDRGAFALTYDEVLTLFTTPITVGGQVTTFGNFLASHTDALIRQRKLSQAVLSTPSSKTTLKGSVETFSVGIQSDYLTLAAFKWKVGEVYLDGETSHSLTVTASSTASYTVEITLPFGSTSHTFTLTVVETPTFSIQPVGGSHVVGQTHWFESEASDPENSTIEYQWYLNGAAISGATNRTYTTPSLTLTDNGNEYWVAATNLYGSTLSTHVTLAVTES